MNILYLDMDGVLNSDELIDHWLINKKIELKNIVPIQQLNKIIKIQFKKYFNDGYELIFSELAERLNNIINKCDLKIIWSTTWRTGNIYSDINNAKNMFNRRGLNGEALIDYTPNLRHGFYYNSELRIEEILLSIKEHQYNPNKDKIAAIDDMNLSKLEDYNIKFFLTDERFGLTEEIANQMENYFNES